MHPALLSLIYTFLRRAAAYLQQELCPQSNCYISYTGCDVSTTVNVNVRSPCMSPYITWQKFAHIWKERTVSIFTFLGNVRKFLSHHAITCHSTKIYLSCEYWHRKTTLYESP